MSAEMEKKKTAEVVWLDYFNEYLFEHGIIDEVTKVRPEEIKFEGNKNLIEIIGKER